MDIASQSSWYVNEVDIAGQSSWSRSKSKCIPVDFANQSNWHANARSSVQSGTEVPWGSYSTKSSVMELHDNENVWRAVSTQSGAKHVSRTRCRPYNVHKIATWNVEGLNLTTGTKLQELQAWMRKESIGILCMQETHVNGSSYWLDDGFLIILSGDEGSDRSYAGVGFIVAPWLKHAVTSFLQFNGRLASIRIRVPGGQICLVTVYAPTNKKPFEDRHAFYSEAGEFIRAQRSHGPTFTLGDFNAKVHKRLPGEENIIGNHVFGNPAHVCNATANRELLLELCMASDNCLANTMFAHEPEALTTYRDLGVDPLAPVSPSSFAQLDFIPIPLAWLHCVMDIRSDRKAALRTQHFVLIMELSLDIPKQHRKANQQLDIRQLKDPAIQQRFCRAFKDNYQSSHDATVADMSSNITMAMKEASKKIPVTTTCARKPWISARTLALIDRRNNARISGNHALESDYNRQIKSSAKHDRKIWLEDLLQNGTWEFLRHLKKNGPVRQGRLRDLDGKLVDSQHRSETLAEYLEKVQWVVKFADCQPDESVIYDNTLPILMTNFSHKELAIVVARLKANRAAGHDDIPPDFWKCLANDVDCLDTLLHLVNVCWQSKSIPETWKHSTVVTLFKKGDTSLPSNYRPISLLVVAYKILAALLLDRLRSGGVENRKPVAPISIWL